MSGDLYQIGVEHCGFVTLQFFDDGLDGKLVIAEGERSVPFAIKRMYFITGLNNPAAVRGKHAHKKLEQYIFCLSGSFTLDLDDGENRQTLVMESPFVGIRLGPKLWHTMRNFSRGCVILVLADDYYNPDDYLRDYASFLEYVHSHRVGLMAAETRPVSSQSPVGP